MAPYVIPQPQLHVSNEEAPSMDLFFWTLAIQTPSSQIERFSCSCLAEVSSILSTRIRNIDCVGAGRYHIDLESHLHTPRLAATPRPVVHTPPSETSENRMVSGRDPEFEADQAAHPNKSESNLSTISSDAIVLKNSISYTVSRKLFLSTELGLCLSRYPSVLLAFISSAFVILVLSHRLMWKQLQNNDDLILPVIGLWVSVLLSAAYWFLALHRMNKEMAWHAMGSFEVVAIALSLARAMAAYVVNHIRLSHELHVFPAVVALTLQAFNYGALLSTFDALRLSSFGRKVLVISTFAIALYIWLFHLLNRPEDAGWDTGGAKIAVWLVAIQPRDHFIAGFGTMAMLSGGAVWSLMVRGRDFAFLYDFLSVAPETRPSFQRGPTKDVDGNPYVLGCATILRICGRTSRAK